MKDQRDIDAAIALEMARLSASNADLAQAMFNDDVEAGSLGSGRYDAYFAALSAEQMAKDARKDILRDMWFPIWFACVLALSAVGIWWLL